MKHILGMVKPQLDCRGANVRKLELDYLRLIYAVSEIRRQGESAQGYFVVITDNVPNRLNHWEHDYHGREYAEVLSVSLDSYLKSTVRTEKTEIISGIVRAAILERGDSESAAAFHRNLREFILAEIILSLEPDAQPVRDEKKFPFGIRWDFYGVVE